MRRPRARIAAVVVVLALVALVAAALLRRRPAAYVLWLYGFADEPSVQQILVDLDEAGFGQQVVLADLAVRENGERFASLMTAINVKADIALLPESVERRTAPPYLHTQNRDRYYSDYIASIVGVFRGDRLVAVVVGATWQSDGFWREVLAETSSRSVVRVFTASGDHEVSEPTLVAEIARLLQGTGV